MENLLDSVRRIISRWVTTNTPLEEDANPGDTVLTVRTSNRFHEGDEAIIRNPSQGETPIYIDEIVDNTHVRLTEPVVFRWTKAENSILEKTFNQNCLQAVYIGDPDVIPRFPAITVTGTTLDSEWWTLDSTKETYNVEISVYVRDANQEGAFRFLMQVVDAIRTGLKANIFPLVGPYTTTTLAEDIAINDEFIVVNNVNLFQRGSKIDIEDRWNAADFMVTSVISEEPDGSGILQLSQPVCYAFTVEDNTQVILKSRFFWNSWPTSIQYGKIFKGTLLKAAQINWFAWEEKIGPRLPRETHIL